MGEISNKVSSKTRFFLNSIRRNMIRSPIMKKKISVFYHNMHAVLDRKKAFDNEVFGYKKIINGKKYYWGDDIYYGNTMYGISKILKDYSGYKGVINACIEHGLYFGNTYFEDEAIDSGMNGLITYGESRILHLAGISKVPVIAIGPYIHYADAMLSSEEIQQLKEKNGRTLLVFPTHSIDRVEMSFDIDGFCAQINKYVKLHEIKHVMVCLFYKDINIGRDKYYTDRGYKVVCCGYRCDPNFLRRLKTFILLSDYTMSNDVGTNVGYCIYLDRPHYIYNQKLEYKAYTARDMENIFCNKSQEEETEEIRKAFELPVEKITDNQKNIYNKYWGVNYVRSREELKKILYDLENKV